MNLNEDLNGIIISNIKFFMKQQGKKNRELAVFLGVTDASVSQKLLGQRPIFVEEVLRYAEFLGVDPVTLLEKEVVNK